ncbi:hypothetical protein [Actinomyces faecalis]|uniref:hypothetical protein n=1 Tax=Actinomyces faecalis TaxID=2722820 RepID=UPI0015575ECA|nr:hypothetical protein [Actinomyces faecalis]
MIAQWSDVTASLWIVAAFGFGAWVGRVFRRGVRLTLAGWAYGAACRLERVSDRLIGSVVRAGRDQ